MATGNNKRLIDQYTDEDYENNRIVNKKAKGTKKRVVKREILFNNYLDSLFKNKVLYRSQQRFRSDYHKVYTEVNKIALSSMMIKEYRHLIGLLHIHMVLMYLRFAKMKCC